ncbi:hypothetical protein [Niallia taxi]|uniref:hypothetical protein n=1 Tax=Niallia taxi TaxID=2499688 RepID=UPI00300A50BC
MFEEFPNVLVIPDNEETLDEIIDDYVAMINYNLEHGVSVKEFLEMFAQDVSDWSFQQYLITAARQSFANLEEFKESLSDDLTEELDEDE